MRVAQGILANLGTLQSRGKPTTGEGPSLMQLLVRPGDDVTHPLGSTGSP
jgi:hypothetical protein